MSRSGASTTALPPAARWALAALSGTAVFLAYPNWNLHALCWVAYAPLLLAADGLTVRRAFVLGLFAGTITNAGGFHWMTEMLREFGHLPAPVTWAILALQAVTQGLATAVGLGLWRLLVRAGAPSGLAAFLSLWAGEAAVPMIFPWYLGNGIAAEIPMVQIAELGGVALVSAQLFASNAALGELLLALRARRRPALGFVGAVLLAVALSAGYGVLRIDQVDAEEAAARKLKIGLVEGDVGIWEKEARHLDGPERVRVLRKNLLKHQRMTAELAAQGAELVLWPESAYQPYGAVPVVFSRDRFVVFGAAGTALRHDGETLSALPRGEGLEGLGLLSGASAPRADIWRLLEDGRRVWTFTPWGRYATELPERETGVDTTSPEIDLMGRLKPTYILARGGRVWVLDLPPEPLRRQDEAKRWQGELTELEQDDAEAIDATAIAHAASGEVLIVGRGGALRAERNRRIVRVNSPTERDLWDVCGDPQGAALVAVGAGGVVLRGRADRMRVEREQGPDLYGCFFDAAGTIFAVGAQGTLLRRPIGGGWKPVRTGLDIDLVAGAADARGHLLLLGRGGKAFERDAKGQIRPLATGTERELTAVLGFQAQAQYSIPRRAARILPSATALPDRKLAYPEDVLADQRTPEFDRSTPLRGFDVPLLMGAMTFGGELPMRNADCRACFNSALLMRPDGDVLGLYDKAFLLVFGEYIPFGERFPELYDLLPESSRFQAGTRTEPLRLGENRLGVLICYEDLLPGFARSVAVHDPHVLLNLTNDAWFGQTAEPYHHLQLAQMRAVEYRRWLVRSTNTGVSVFVDAAGRRRQETALTEPETLLADVPMLESRTVYARLGDWPRLLLVLWLLLLWGRAVRGGGQAGPSGGKKSGRSRAKPREKAAKPAAQKRRSATPKEPETLEPTRLGS